MNTTTWCWATLPRQGRDRPACQPGASSGVWLAALVAVALGLGGCDDPLDQEIDQDGDGYRLLQGDCDDRDPRVHPGARDGRNGKDDDCDGQTDEDAPLDDADEDGFRPLDGDCDDTRADVYPGAPESGDAVRDHDCDGHVGCPDPAPAGPPTVLASWPADDATVVPPLAQVVLRLSEPVRCSGPCLRLYGDPADGSPQLDQGGEPLGAFVLFDLPADLAVDRTYTVEIHEGAIRDLCGNPLAPQTIRFHLAAAGAGVDPCAGESFPEAGTPCGSSTGECRPGVWWCEEGKLVCLGGVREEPEVCNGLDDDCDDETDEQVEPASGACGSSVGECRPGLPICQEGEWGCAGGQAPTEEVCDGLDNDCDGLTDEGSLEVGALCGSAVGECVPGAVACEAGELICQGGRGPRTELCNGRDDDCDGETDSQAGEPVCPCADGEQEECGEARGQCQPGVRLCHGGIWSECLGAQSPGEERCNGLDDDCDGLTDEEFPEQDVPCAGRDAGESALPRCLAGTLFCGETVSLQVEVCDGLDNDLDGATDEDLLAPPSSKNHGVCTARVAVCAGALGWIDPAFTELPGYEAAEASCDGRDNDCDGQVDEDLTPPPASQHVGVCAGLRQRCEGARGWQEPSYRDVSHFEVVETSCDGRDNDCDGRVDEDLLAPPASKLAGVCAGTVKTCQDGAWRDPVFTALPGYEAVEVTCDGRDNDCDGLVDEDLTPPAATRHVGVCAGLRQRCEGARGWHDPDYAQLPAFQSVEASCDGLDNDCDGRVDEELAAPPASKLAGVCAGAVKACEGGVWRDPAFTSLPGYEAAEATCDGLDNDCDGLLDHRIVNGEPVFVCPCTVTTGGVSQPSALLDGFPFVAPTACRTSGNPTSLILDFSWAAGRYTGCSFEAAALSNLSVFDPFDGGGGILGVEICIPAGKPAVQGNIGLWYQKREDRRTSDYRKRLFLQAWHNPVQPGTCRQVYFTPQDTTCVKWGSWCDNEACVGCDPAAWSRNSVQFLLLAEDSRVAQNDLTIELRPLQYHQGEGCTCTKVPPGSCPQGLACDVLANGVPDARCEPGVRCRGVCSQ